MLNTLGGIGLFLLGMTLLTDGIKALAGTALREVLTRFVRGPVTATLSGAALTAILQSSSATMLTTIGFVSAGLITFPQAIGVIFGANIGTTSTGWIVSLLGFKLSMGAIALPVVFVGAMMRLLGRGRTASAGVALAGFGVLFFGIALMQEGMGGMAERIDLGALPGDGMLGALVLVVVGIVMTLLMQSSSAAMAVTLAALHTGGIDVTQGAALVIGQNVGTSVTTALAAIGATNAAKRTALAHILFNVLTGVVAFALLPVFARSVEIIERAADDNAGVATLAGFHTAFNVIGVMIFLPVSARFARLVERMVPERAPSFAAHLDASVAELGPVALEAARRALADILAVFLARTVSVCRGETPARDGNERFDQARRAIPYAANFVARIGAETGKQADVAHQIGLVHAIDHLERLGEVIDRLDDRPELVRRGDIEPVREAAEELVRSVLAGFTPEGWAGEPEGLAERSAAIAALRKSHRVGLLEKTARGAVAPEVGGDLIETIRWLDAVGYHTIRTLHHLRPPALAADQAPAIDPSSSHLA